MAFGVTTEGFVVKTLLDIKAEVEADWRAEFGANVDLDPNSPDGQIIGVICDRLAELWELAQAVYSAQDPDKASGQAQDAICAITGTFRDVAVESTVTLTCTGTAATALTSGREVSVAGTGDRFTTLANVVLAALTAWAGTTAYVAGDRRSNAGNSYLCITSGTSAGAGGPTSTAADITDGTVHWRYLGAGTAAVDVAAESVETGPISAASGTLTVIETPVSGWDSAINIEDAVPGANVEEDDALRVKRESELAAAGAGTLPALRSAVLQVDGVTSCVVFENATDVTDGDGRPPHSVECVVEGGTDAAIAAAIFDNLSAGITPYGTTTEAVVDSSGLSWNISFSRVSLINIWHRLDVTVDANTFPVDGEDQIIAAIVADETSGYYAVGKNVTSSRGVSRCYQVPGVLDVTISYIGTANPAAAATTIAIGPTERADLDTARVVVNVVTGTP